MIQPSDFITIALLVALEGLLSADNAMVLAVLVLGLPKGQQKKALRYGILGAFAFRSVAVVLAAFLIRSAGEAPGAAYPPPRRSSFLLERWASPPPPATSWLGLTPFWSTVEGQTHRHRSPSTRSWSRS